MKGTTRQYKYVPNAVIQIVIADKKGNSQRIGRSSEYHEMQQSIGNVAGNFW